MLHYSKTTMLEGKKKKCSFSASRTLRFILTCMLSASFFREPSSIYLHNDYVTVENKRKYSKGWKTNAKCIQTGFHVRVFSPQ